MSEPTPGPWEVDGPPHNQIIWSIQDDDSWQGRPFIPIDDDALGGRICEIYGSFDGGGITETDRGNARLIAAAPELLAELDCRAGDLFMLRKAIEAGDPTRELLVRIDDMIRETRAAIAKARGEV